MNIYIETVGCPKNVNDSEVAAGILVDAGHGITKDIAGAGAVLVNTCGFIDEAKRESIDKIFEMARVKNKDALLIISGCLPERYGDKIYKEIPEADIVIGVSDYPGLPELIKNYKGMRAKRFSESGGEYIEPRQRLTPEGAYSATLKIAEGCDNVCSYCVIPSIRGKYRSRKKENIIEEARRLASFGCKELVIIAQDVTAYGIDLYGKYVLAELLQELCKIDGVRWIRLMYCYEDRITDELIETMRREDKICKYIDMPVQHCSDKILAAMNRRSTKKSIITTIEKLRRAIPGIHIRTTLIAGFPGEGREEFFELLEFTRAMRFDRLGVFAYSKEEGTPAAVMKNQVRASEKESRKDKLMLAQLQISRELNSEKTGGVFEVLVEGQDTDGVYCGRSRCDAPEIDNSVMFTSERELFPGDFVNVKIQDAFDYDLFGREV